MPEMPLDRLVDFLEMPIGAQKPAAEAELARRAALSAERQALAAERAALATEKYTKYTFWVVIFAALAAVASAISAGVTLYGR